MLSEYLQEMGTKRMKRSAFDSWLAAQEKDQWALERRLGEAGEAVIPKTMKCGRQQEQAWHTHTTTKDVESLGACVRARILAATESNIVHE